MNLDFLHFDIVTLVQGAGYIGLFAIIFAESGLFFGFFLPGGSLLFTAGLLASQGFFSIWILIPVLGSAAILGDSVGYWFGKSVGPTLFSKEDSLFFNKKHLGQTQRFYAKYGSRTIVIGRFIPIVRTFAPILAGVGMMNYKTFLKYNIVGAILWAIGVTWLGYILGTKVPGVDRFLLPIILCIIVSSLIPIVVEVWKKK